jgi:hypothetical protein
MAPSRSRTILSKERFPSYFSSLKTQTYHDPGSRGPGSHAYVYISYESRLSYPRLGYFGCGKYIILQLSNDDTNYIHHWALSFDGRFALSFCPLKSYTLLEPVSMAICVDLAQSWKSVKIQASAFGTPSAPLRPSRTI